MIGQLWRGAALSLLIAVGAAAASPDADATTIKEFSSGLAAGSDLLGITAGPDGNLWFTDGGTTRAIGKATPSGVIKEFTTGLNTGGKPSDILEGPDGNLWFTELGSPNNAIGRVTPAGVITEFTSGLNTGSAPSNIVVGPDGNLWFLDGGTTKAIGRITPAGTITEFKTGLQPMSQPNDLTVGADGNLWFTDQGSAKEIGRVTPSGTITEFSSGLDQLHSFPNGLTAGADGNVWFSDDGSSAIGRVTPAGTIMEFTIGLPTGSQPDALTVAPDGNVWFTDQLSGHKAIGRITPSGSITEFSTGLDPMGLQDDITVGPDGNLWIEQSMTGGLSTTGGIARITPSGVITQLTAGLNMGAGSETDQLIVGPDGNLWFTDNGTTKAIGRVALELAPTGTAPQSTSANFGDQKIALTTPSQRLCTARTRTLGATFSSSAMPKSHHAKLRFMSAAFYIDKGVRHTRKKTERLRNGRQKTVIVAVYTANAIARHVPAKLALRLAGLSSRAHTLMVRVSYKESLTTHGHRTTVTLTKTLRVTFRVC